MPGSHVNGGVLLFLFSVFLISFFSCEFLKEVLKGKDFFSLCKTSKK